jgi:hypothetical protein
MRSLCGVVEKSLDANMPDHLPKPIWMGQEDSIVKWYTDRTLPVPYWSGSSQQGAPQPSWLVKQ